MYRLPRFGAVLGTLFLLGSSTGAIAAAVNAEASVGSISPCPSFCGGFGTAFGNTSDGGAGVASASTSLHNVDGDGRVLADLSGPAQLPVLHAEAQSHAASASQRSSNVQAVGTAMRQYLYNGPATSVDLMAVLHGAANATHPSDALLLAHVLAYAGPDLDVFSTSYGTLRFEIIPGLSDLTVLDEVTLTVPTNGGVQSVNGTLSLALNDGDSFFVWAQLITSGTRGGSANGFDTLNLQFGDATGITPVGPAAVPLPNMVLLEAGALLALVLRRRRCARTA